MPYALCWTGREYFSRIQGKAKSLLYPYFVLGTIVIIYYTVVSVIAGNVSLIGTGKKILALLYGNYIWENNATYIGTLWFVVALFCSEILYYIAMHLYEKWRMIFVAAITITGALLSALNMYQKIRLPWCLDVACVAFLFLFVGSYIKNKELSISNIIVSLSAGFIIGISNLLAMKAMNYSLIRVDMLLMNYGILPLFLVSASLISIGFIGISKAIYRKRHFESVEHIGRISLLVMVIHLYVIQIAGRFIHNCFFMFLLSSFVSVAMGMLVERYMPWMYRFPKK